MTSEERRDDPATAPDGGPLHGGEDDPLGEGVDQTNDENGGSEASTPPVPDDEPMPGV